MKFYISEVAEKVGVHANTVRNLERRGMIKPQRGWQGWRIFSEKDVEEIRKILFPDGEKEARS